ncbi:hypothetical protein Ade02nite_74950 [Paractinoplanes deccanensis]|uniref:Uncharacterized protein n=1 Tax=Paractinoplanes deccanensis TaxID=113561 RepID=A0ABQ3YFS3_9ACTN|nr:hypothetical protein [Actinoplanes deccanensis]GID78854.1 hypothetical protein Ade02nite_74950 [Actinoplanes deccanensis]
MTNSFEGAGEVGSSDTSLKVIANRCAAGSCPTIYESASGSLVVQGFIVKSQNTGIDVPAGEALVEIPAELLAEAMRNLS